MDTLTGLLKKSAAGFPSRKALSVAGKWSLTHARLDELVDQAAAQLIAGGIRPGDVVALVFPNTLEFVVAFLAVIRARAVAAPLNPAYTVDEFVFYLSDSDSKLLLVPDSGHKNAESAAARLPITVSIVAIDATIDSVSLSLPPLAGVGSISPSENKPSDTALFLHTSGTTSRPKGVPLTQGNLGASVSNIKSVYRLVEGDASVVVLPLFHVHGLLAGLLSPLAAGASVALPAGGRFSASAFWAEMAAAGATWYTAVPTIHQILLDRHEHSDPSARPAYPKLRFIRSCSASLAPAVMARMESAFGAPVLEAYAMTEASHLMASNPLPEDGPHKAGAVGRPVGQEMAILDENGGRVGVDKPGEVCVRGPNVTSGYRNNPEANRAAFQFGWFHTGDVGYLDSDGYLHLVGRIKELINRGGEKISPIEVDAVLLAHMDVAEAVSFGVPDDKFGEEINCAVIPHEGVVLTESDIVSHCRKNLASFKVPKRVFIADSLPKTASGKVQRRIVAEHFLAMVSAAKVPKFGA